jgi:hypothetical protein
LLLLFKEVFTMPYIEPEVIREAKRIDLLTYLQNYEPNELMRLSAGAYCTRSHDSLKISNGKWMWHSRGIGGKSALDYLIKVRDMAFTDAVEHIMGRAAAAPPVHIPGPQEPPKPFALPPQDAGISEVERYLTGRGISLGLIRYCAGLRTLYQTRNKGYANAVFVGFDADNIPRYATVRGCHGNFKGDVGGSDKRYSFALGSGSASLHVFESAVDLLSFATLQEIKTPDRFDGCLLSLSGIYKPRKNIRESALPPALAHCLSRHPEIRSVRLHLDNDPAGRLATEAIMAVLPKEYAVADEPPPSGKDYNDHLCDRLNLRRTKNLRQNHVR